MTVDPVMLVVSALAALPAGWFAGALVDRVPSGTESLLSPLPAVRFTGKYLVMYVLLLVLNVGAALRFADDGWWVLVPFLVVFCALVALAVIDVELLRLPDRIVVPTLLVSIPMIVVASIADGDAVAIQRALIGGAVYFGFLFLFHLIFGNRGMGFGDVKMSAILGLYLGWIGASTLQVIAYVLWALVIGVLSGTIIGIVLFAVRRRSRSYPFGPFLIGGALVLVFFGTTLVTAR